MHAPCSSNSLLQTNSCTHTHTHTQTHTCAQSHLHTQPSSRWVWNRRWVMVCGGITTLSPSLYPPSPSFISFLMQGYLIFTHSQYLSLTLSFPLFLSFSPSLSPSHPSSSLTQRQGLFTRQVNRDGSCFHFASVLFSWQPSSLSLFPHPSLTS